MDTPTAIIVMGLLVAAGGWGIPFFTLRSNTAAQNVLTVDTARKAEVDQLTRRITLLEDDNRRLLDRVNRCEEEREEDRKKYIALLEGRIFQPPPSRRRPPNKRGDET